MPVRLYGLAFKSANNVTDTVCPTDAVAGELIKDSLTVLPEAFLRTSWDRLVSTTPASRPPVRTSKLAIEKNVRLDT
jgi:hypothetical protein